jgi:hypothetical protein
MAAILSCVTEPGVRAGPDHLQRDGPRHPEAAG